METVALSISGRPFTANIRKLDSTPPEEVGPIKWVQGYYASARYGPHQVGEWHIGMGWFERGLLECSQPYYKFYTPGDGWLPMPPSEVREEAKAIAHWLVTDKLGDKSTPLDNYTQQLLELAYESYLHKRRRKKGDRPGVPEIVELMWKEWINERDLRIYEWRDRILERLPNDRLAAKLNAVDTLLHRFGEYWELPYLEEEEAFWVAQGLAVLRWIFLENRDRVPKPRFNTPQLITWLGQRFSQAPTPATRGACTSRRSARVPPEKPPARQLQLL